MAIPNPNPNIADGVKSDITTYSSNKIESLISVATELPIPAAGDAGKVLTVNSDEDGYELDAIPDELPTPEAGDAGKVLTVNDDSDGYELNNIPVPATVDITADITTIEGVTINYGHVSVTGNIVTVNLVLECAVNISNNSTIVEGLPRAAYQSRQFMGNATSQWQPSSLGTYSGVIDNPAGVDTSVLAIMGNVTASPESKVYLFNYFTYVI